MVETRVFSKLFSRVAVTVVPILTCFAPIHSAWATPPTLYSQSNYQSPVRGDPDDLLLLPGYGFGANDVVVYQAIADTTQSLNPPTSVPGTSTASLGIAPVVSYANTPDSLTVKLPAVLQSGQSYALWVMNSNGEWSNGIKINDARPLWITPDYAYSTASVASLPRYLKVVGRNMQPAPGTVTQVKLVGPSTYTLTAANDGDPSTTIEEYVANVSLPSGMLPGGYTVQVSRDGVGWVTLDGQTLTVNPDPAPPQQFAVSNYGCTATDGEDDTPCIIKAINDAQQAGGGNVVFGPGVWEMDNSTVTGVSYDGVIVPQGVNLVGQGTGQTTVLRGAGWSPNCPTMQPTLPVASFTLQGKNVVQGITFQDACIYQPSDNSYTIFQLGKAYWRAGAGDPKQISNVTITQNVFDKPFVAIRDGGLPIDHLFVTYNEVGAYNTAFAPEGNPNYVTSKFHIDDSIVANNTFKPGSYIDVSIAQGTIASQIGAARRLDFSGNTADGTSTQYLYNPTTDPKGWRAGFFWALDNNTEMMLVSQNTETCTGDKDGDGEAIAYDNNENTFGFTQAQTVLSATTNTVTVTGPLEGQQNGKTVPSDYYNEHWVQIAQGPGVGQVRQIVSYSVDSSGSPVTFTVSPAWDVIPQTTSLLTVAREYWQVYTVDNFVDHRTPLCLKSNQTAPRGGKITLYAQTADSTVEGNKQYDTDGIQLHQSYSAPDPINCPSCTSNTFFHSFVEVRGNTVDHEYDWSSDCSWSGLWGDYSASPSSPTPVVGYGVSFARNTIIQADALRGGAITLSPSWSEGPPGYTGKLVNNTLIYHNVIQDLIGPVPQQQCDYAQLSRIGSQLYDPLVWQTVLYANSCNNVSTLLHDGGTGTVRVCPSGVLDSCECAESDMAVSMTSSAATVNLGDNVTYTAQVTNKGLSNASGVTLADNLPSGMSPISANTTQGTCTTGQTVTCNIGGVVNGGSATVTIVATAATIGVQTNAAIVSNVEADPNPANNSATVTTTVNAPDLTPTAVSATKSGTKVYVSDTAINQGNSNAGAFTVSYFLSTNTTYEPGTDLALVSTSGGSTPCTRTVNSLSPGATSSVSNQTCYKPANVVTGQRYYVLVVDDVTNQVIESNETNNGMAAAGQVWW